MIEQSQSAGGADRLDDLIGENAWEPAYAVFMSTPDPFDGTSKGRISVIPSKGWTMLHWLCTIGSVPAHYIESVASLYPEAIAMSDSRYGDTPLHLICRNSQTSTNKLEILLRLLPSRDGVLQQNIFGATALHSASNHNARLEILKMLVAFNPVILQIKTHGGIHAVVALWQSYMQTIPGSMVVARFLKGNADVLDSQFYRFYQKVEFLSTQYYADRYGIPDNQDLSNYVLHGLLSCHVELNMFKVALRRYPRYATTPDVDSNLPLHRLLVNRPFRLKEREAIQEMIQVAPQAASHANCRGEFPLLIAIQQKIPWENGVDILLDAGRTVVSRRDPETGLLPFQVAAMVGNNKAGIETIFHVLVSQPDLLNV